MEAKIPLFLVLIDSKLRMHCTCSPVKAYPSFLSTKPAGERVIAEIVASAAGQANTRAQGVDLTLRQRIGARSANG